MPIEGEDSLDFQGLHQRKRNTISETDPLVCILPQQFGCGKLMLQIWPDNPERLRREQSVRCIRSESGAHPSRKVIDRLTQDHVGRYEGNPLELERIPGGDGPMVMLIALQVSRDECARINKDHSVSPRNLSRRN